MAKIRTQQAHGQLQLQFFLNPVPEVDVQALRSVSHCDAVVRGGLAQVLEGRDREALAAELTERLARSITKATLDQWCAPSQADRRPHVDAWLAIMQITGDVSPLELAAASLGRRVLTIDEALLAEYGAQALMSMQAKARQKQIEGQMDETLFKSIMGRVKRG